MIMVFELQDAQGQALKLASFGPYYRHGDFDLIHLNVPPPSDTRVRIHLAVPESWNAATSGLSTSLCRKVRVSEALDPSN